MRIKDDVVSGFSYYTILTCIINFFFESLDTLQSWLLELSDNNDDGVSKHIKFYDKNSWINSLKTNKKNLGEIINFVMKCNFSKLLAF